MVDCRNPTEKTRNGCSAHCDYFPCDDGNSRVRSLVQRLGNLYANDEVAPMDMSKMDTLNTLTPKQRLDMAKKEYPKRRDFIEKKADGTGLFYVAKYAVAVDSWFLRWFGEYEETKE